MPSLFLAEGTDPLSHVVNTNKTIWWVGEIGLGSAHEVMLLIAGVLTVLLLLVASRRIRTGDESQGNDRYVTKGRLSQIVEVMVLYLRDQMLEPVLGAKQTKRWMPFLLSTFFFILTVNLLGMIPFQDFHHLFGLHHFALGGTATANINVTITLALFAFAAIQIHSFRELGFLGWLDHLTCGLAKGPKGLWLVVPVVFVVEFAGVFIKPVALAIRLFANMMGGHILLATVIMLPSMPQLDLQAGSGAWFGITFATGAFAVALTFLELFVAFLQAFVFMFLTAVFISLMSHEEHEEEDHASEELAEDLAAAH